jgi:RHS repeat-associated protein
MVVPSIERMTAYGLPRYTSDDAFAADGGEQLVAIPGTDPPEYRLRFEGSFVRYRWIARGDGKEGSWTAEQPDGTVLSFGADADGTLAADARLGTAAIGTFRYLLRESVDRWGHRVHYEYRASTNIDGVRGSVGTPLLSAISYLYRDTQAVYRIELDYENRADRISDAKGGFNEASGERLRAVHVKVGGTEIRTYRLTFEDGEASGGLSRLRTVETFGLNGEKYPLVHAFEYSRALGIACTTDTCGMPYLVEMGSLGVDLKAGKATLADLNGDALPDVIVTSESGNHRYYLSKYETSGAGYRQSFGSGKDSAFGAGYTLGTKYVHVLDVDGDGFADMVNAKTKRALFNGGTDSGDWKSEAALASAVGARDLSTFIDQYGIESIQFVDIDNDKRIDVLASSWTGSSGETRVLRNLPSGFQDLVAVGPIGAGFTTEKLQLSDMNGDNLQDPVMVRSGQIWYRLNLGWGKWSGVDASDWVKVDLGITAEEAPFVSFEDLNGDQVSDVVIVKGGSVRYALNRTGGKFDAFKTLSQVNGVPVPVQDPVTTTVLFADMNGNGSSDIVWVTGTGKVTYLELFPVRPGLMSKVENGLGQVTEVRYGTSVQHMAVDGGNWKYRLPHPMTVVDQLDTYDELSQVHDVVRYHYRDAYFDGPNKQFRGFAAVETSLQGDDSQEDGLERLLYDVGADDPYRHGLLLSRDTTSGGREISSTLSTYADCRVGGLKDPLSYPVRHVCEVATSTTFKEGKAASQWVTVDTRSEYDEWGNVTKLSELGVTAIGGTPCGAKCEGDERYAETLYALPNRRTGGWILSAPYEQRSYGKPGSAEMTLERTYYDGPDFQGLPLGTIDRGAITRVETLVSVGGPTISSARYRRDAHGNVVESIDPNGTIQGTTHRELVTYDSDGLEVVRTEQLLEDAQGAYQLRRDTAWDPLWNEPTQAANDSVVRGGSVVSAGAVTRYAYDAFGRRTKMALPGDTLDSPTEVYSYDLGRPTTRVAVQRRSRSGGALDVEEARCIDGRGRPFQTRTRIDGGTFQVTGFEVFNKRGQTVRVYQPHQATKAGCDVAAPTDGTLFTAFRYDALHRLIAETEPDGTVRRTSYVPLATVSYDEEDSDPTSPFKDTPTIERVDGLERVVAIERYTAPLASSAPSTIAIQYDSLGRFAGYTDPGGHKKTQEHDLLGRIIRARDPNTGLTSYEYDAVGNITARRDARGTTTRALYDGANRIVEIWDEADRPGTSVRTAYDELKGCAECTNGAGSIVEVRYPLGKSVKGAADGYDRFGYDARQRQTFQRRVLDGHTFDTRYGYDNSDRNVETVHPDGQVLRHEYDAASRLTAIDGVLGAVTYDARGLLASARFANGASTHWSYDPRQRLSGVHSTSKTGKAFYSTTVRRDRVGNVRGIDDGAEKLPGRIDRSTNVEYDALYRPLRVTYGAASGAETVSYTYDALDNIVSQRSSIPTSPAQVGDYTYADAAPNAVTHAGALDVGYDKAGNVIRRGDVSHARDHLGRLAQAKRADDVIASFAFADGAERVMKVEGGSVTYYANPDFEVRDGVGTLYARLGTHRVARLSSDAIAPRVLSDLAPATIANGAFVRSQPDGHIRASDAWLAQAATSGALTLPSGTVTSPVAHLLKASATRMLFEELGKTAYLHGDHLGSIVFVTDPNGDVSGEQDFYGFGQVRATSGYIDAFGFTGQEADESTGLLHFAARDLDPALGRWESSDPAFEHVSEGTVGELGESTTGYAYAANNWTTSIDPNGLSKSRPFRPNRIANARRRGKLAYHVTNAANVRGILQNGLDPNRGGVNGAGAALGGSHGARFSARSRGRVHLTTLRATADFYFRVHMARFVRTRNPGDRPILLAIRVGRRIRRNLEPDPDHPNAGAFRTTHPIPSHSVTLHP